MDKIKVIICEPGKAARVEEIENTLESKQKIVGGLIEMHIPPSHEDDTCIIINDEGKLLELPPNRPLFTEDGDCYDVVAGSMIVVRAPEDSDEFASLTDEQIKKYMDMYAPTFIDVGTGYIYKRP